MGFTKAWKELMEPCLLLRTKSSASMFWYKTQRESKTYGESWVARFYPEPSPREYLRKARALLRIRREEALRFPCEREPPTLSSQLERDIVFHHWSRTQPAPADGTSGDDHYDHLEAEFRKVSKAEKLRMYIRWRQGERM